MAAMGDPMQAWPMPFLLHMSSRQYRAAPLGAPVATEFDNLSTSRGGQGVPAAAPHHVERNAGRTLQCWSCSTLSLAAAGCTTRECKPENLQAHQHMASSCPKRAQL